MELVKYYWTNGLQQLEHWNCWFKSRQGICTGCW